MATDHNFRIKNGLHVQGGTATFHSVPNNSDLVIGGVIAGHDSGDPARITTSSTGQLYLDSTSGQDIYLGWWGSSSANIITEHKIRAPAFYDRNNTGYYVNPATNSVLNDIDMRGTNTKLPGHAYSNTHDNTNTYWHIGLGNESTNHVLNLRVFNSSNSYVNHRFMATGADIVGNLNVTGNLTVTGSIDRNSVTDLDVVDKTITVGVGQSDANSGGSGLIVAGSGAQLLWDYGDNRWEMNENFYASGHITAGSHLSGNNIYNTGNFSTLNTAGSGWDTVIARNGGSPYADMKHSYRMNGTTVIDSSRNLTNIGTINCNAITSSGIFTINEELSGDASQFIINNTQGATFRMGITGSGSNEAAHIKTNASEALEFHIGQSSASTTPDITFLANGGGIAIQGQTVIDASRNLTNIGTISSGSVTAGDSSTAASIRAHYNDGSYMTLEGYGLSMNRGASYIRPTTDGDKTLYIGGADASLDWSAIHFRSVNGLALGGTNFIDGSRNLQNIGTISSGVLTVNGGASNVVANFISTDGTAGIKLQDSAGNVELSAAGTTFQVQPSGGAAKLTVDASGNTTTLGYLQHYGVIYSRDNLNVLNAAGNGWHAWATRASGNMNLSVGTIVTGGALTVTGSGAFRYSSTEQISLSPTSTGGVLNVRNSSGTSVAVLDGRGTPFIDVTGNLKTGGTTRITSSGAINNVTLGSGTSGARLEVDGWHHDTGNNYRFYFENNGRSFYRSINGHQFRTGTDATDFNISNNGHIHIASNGDSQAGSTEYIKAGGTAILTSSRQLQNVELHSGVTVSTNSSVAQAIRGTVAGINNSGYVHAFKVDGGNLSSQIRFTVGGTVGSVVFNSDVFISCNHYHDILIESTNGFYTILTVKVVSNGNEDFSVFFKSNHANTATVNIVVFPLNDEIITITTTDPGYSTKTLEHQCSYGKSYSGTDNAANKFDITTDGDINAALGYKVNGTEMLSSARVLKASGGSSSLPSISFSDDTNTGLYRSASDNLGFAIGGTAAAFFSTTQFNVTPKIISGTDMRAPIFYDSVSTSRYIDPGSTSYLHSLSINDADLTVHENTHLAKQGSGHGVFLYYNASNSYRGYFDWRTLQLGNNGANNVLFGNTSANGYGRFYTNATAISQSGGVSGTLTMQMLADGTVEMDKVAPITSQINFTGAANGTFSFTNAGGGSANYTNRGGRVLTSNASGWHQDGEDPVISVVDSHTGTDLDSAGIGIYMHNEESTNNAYSPGILFGSKSTSGSYNSMYGAIYGRKISNNSGVDTNWNTGELHFFSVGSGYVTSTPDLKIHGHGYGTFRTAVQAPIFYDSANTAYYLDPGVGTTALYTNGAWRQTSTNWTGEVAGKMQYHGSNWYLQATNNFIFRNASGVNVLETENTGRTTLTGDLRLAAGANLTRLAHYSGHLEGSYNNIGGNATKSNPIYTIGSSYNPDSNGTTLANMYGIGYSNVVASFISGGLAVGDWGMYVAADGDARIFLDGSFGHGAFAGNTRSTAHYDIDNTAYYVNPADTTQSAKFRQHVSIGDGNNLTNDGSWGSRLNLSDSAHSKIEISQDSDSIKSYWWVHNGHDKAYFGTATSHHLELQTSGTTRFKLDKDGGTTNTGNLVVTGDITSNSNVHIGPAGNLGLGDLSHPKIAYPGEPAQWGGSGTTTGQVIIDLPGTLGNYDMTYLEIDVYEYSNQKGGSKIIIGTHNWNSGGDSGTGNQMWYGTDVRVVGRFDKEIYLGWRNNGSVNKRVIVLGTHTSSWSYGTVHVAKVSGATYYNNSIDWTGDWNITQNTSSSAYTKSPTTNWNDSDSRNIRVHRSLQGNRVYGDSDMRSPLYYDLDNTGYYTNPASTSLMNGLQLAGSLLMTAEGASNIKTRFLMGKASGSTGNGQLYLNYGTNSGVYIGAGGGGASLDVAGGLNVAGTSVMTSLQLGTNSSPTLSDVSEYLNVQTSYGYWRMGAGNTSYAHTMTDRPQFYFNKKLVVDEGIIRSYDEDLQLDRAGSATARIRITSGITYSDQSTSAMNLGITANNNHGLGFWDNTSGAAGSYAIYMSAHNGTYGGRHGINDNSDYNMYFKMSAGTNRGWVFKNSSTNVASIDGGGRAGFSRIDSINGTNYVSILAGSTENTLYSLAATSGTPRDLAFDFGMGGKTLILRSTEAQFLETVFLDGATTTSVSTPNIKSSAASDTSGTTQYHITFQKSGTSGTVNGKITTNAFSTTYSTTSDYRLKENIQAVSGATNKVLSLNPVNFRWKNSSLVQDGFLAHEVGLIVPDAIVGEKDAIDSEGNPDYQSIDQAKLVPILVKTIQELEARITALENA